MKSARCTLGFLSADLSGSKKLPNAHCLGPRRGGEPHRTSPVSAMTSTSQERAGLLHGAQAGMSVSDRKILDQLPPMPTPDRNAMCWESVARVQVSNERLPRPAQHPVANTHAREMHCWRLTGT